MDAAMMASMIDQTLLKPNVGEREARRWMIEQRDAGFASLCVAPAMVPWAAEILEGTSTKVCTVVAFPLGYALSASKADETRRLLSVGAVEIDMVMNIGAALDGDWEMVAADVQAVVDVVREHGANGALTKVILETGYLEGDAINEACRRCVSAGAEFVKTSTGFGPCGANVEDVRTMREAVGPKIGVKAAGGIRTLEAAMAMIEAGATRIGTSSGLDIIAALAQEPSAPSAG